MSDSLRRQAVGLVSAALQWEDLTESDRAILGGILDEALDPEVDPRWIAAEWLRWERERGVEGGYDA